MLNVAVAQSDRISRWNSDPNQETPPPQGTPPQPQPIPSEPKGVPPQPRSASNVHHSTLRDNITFGTQ